MSAASIYKERLERLRFLLLHLPSSLPLENNEYKTLQWFQLDEDDSITLASAVHAQLDGIFDVKDDNNVVILVERGAALQEATTILERYLDPEQAENELVEKWLDGLTLAAEAAYERAQMKVC